MKDYLDPKQNPFIQTGDEDGNPRSADEEIPLSESVEEPVPLPGSDGKWPWEKHEVKPAASNSSLSLERFMEGREKYAIYDRYSKEFIFEIVREGDGFMAQTAPGQRRPFNNTELKMLESSIKRAEEIERAEDEAE
jgi:hypothetical protein